MHLTLRTCLYLMFLLAPLRLLAQTPETLNGIAIHSEFGRELFIGALYSSIPLAERIDSLDNIPQLRMELKILAAEGMTVRRFSRIWTEGMSVNNDSARLAAQADNREMFNSLFKDRLLTNDHIVFSYQAKKGVAITVNNILLGKIPSDDFFMMLLSTWVGHVPLSSDYKNAILKAGNIDSDLLKRFANSQTTPERAQEIAGWPNSKPNTETANTKTNTSEPIPNTVKSTSAIASAVSVSAKNTSTAATSSNATAVQQQPEIQSSAPAGGQNSEPENTELTKEVQRVRQAYIAEMLKKIRSNTLYPTRAKELGRTGSLRIAIQIDRTGSILHMRFVKESQHGLLNQAAVTAIKQSQPLPAMPDILPGTRLEFTVPISFVLDK